jgi:hypothetical protein
MRKTLRASVLTLALCGAAFAGDIPTPSVIQPPPGVTAEEQAAGGDMQNDAADGLAETVLNLIEGVLALF